MLEMKRLHGLNSAFTSMYLTLLVSISSFCFSSCDSLSINSTSSSSVQVNKYTAPLDQPENAVSVESEASIYFH